MRIIEQLVYKITGDNSEFDKSIDKSETKITKFGSVADKIFAGVTVAAIGMAVKKMGEMVLSSATALDRVDKLSQKIGLSRTAFQEWDYIIGQSGASVEGLQMGVKTLSNAADEARKGTALYAEAFDKLGVSVTDANGNMKDQETLFAEVFSALADMENQTERTALATKLLGRSATELAPTLNTSKEGIEQLRSEAHSLGLVYSDELVDAGVVLGDNIDRLKKSFEALKTNALAPIIGLAVTFTDKLLGQASASDKLITQANTLVKINKDYKNALKSVEDGYIGVTQASLGLLAAQKEALLFDLEKIYFDSKKELDSLNKTIETNKDINARNNSVLDAMAKKYNTTRDGLARLAAQERISTDDRDKYNDTVDAINVSYGKYIDAVNKANSAEVNRKQFVDNMSEAYAKGQIEIERFIDIDVELYNQIKAGAVEYEKNQKAIEARNKAIELAAAAFRAYENASDEALKRVIAQAKGRETSAYWAEMSRLATEKLNERIVENSLVTDKQTAILANNAQGMEAIDAYALALGDTYNATSEKTSLLTSTIKALIDSGLTAEDEAVANLITQLKALATTTGEVTNTSIESFNAKAKARSDAYKLLESYSLSEKDKAIANIQAQADKFLEAGVSIVDVATWQKNELAKLQEQQAEKAEKEAERARKAWEDATFSMLGSVTSIWGSINQVQANANAQLIATLEKTTAETLKNIDEQTQAKLKAEGVALETTEERLTRERDEALATGDEITANLKTQEIRRNEIIAEADKEKKRIEDEANKRKIDMQIEEAERDKALSTLSVILDTAKAIMQIWANPLIAPWGKGLWTGLAAGAGAAQIAAINSAPVPSYDVGSIRIPETTTATVHKDEMILTAPQAEQARREGITIAPTKNGGNSINLMIYLDGKEIARNTIDNLNSGSVGTIKARVVK